MTFFLLNLLVTPHYIIIQGIGKPQVNVVNHLIGAVVTIGVGTLLIGRLGLYSVLIAMVVAALVANTYMEVMVRRITGMFSLRHVVAI